MTTTVIARPTMWSLHLNPDPKLHVPARWLNLANAQSAEIKSDSCIQITWISGQSELFVGAQAVELLKELHKLPKL